MGAGGRMAPMGGLRQVFGLGDVAAWTATVTKMKEKYGAPLPPEALTNVIDYLVKTYGPERK